MACLNATIGDHDVLVRLSPIASIILAVIAPKRAVSEREGGTRS